jgi:subtilisin family serine protease
MRRWLVCIGAVLVVLGCAGPVRQVTRPEDLSVPKQLQTQQVIVTLAPATLEQWANLTKALAYEYNLSQVGAFPLASLGIQCVVFQVPAERAVADIIARLEADPRVEAVQLNQVFRGLGSIHNDPYATLQYGAQTIRADLAHRRATGKGVKVAVVDTGVETNHPDLRGRVVATANFVDGGEQTFDQDSHGTAIAGVIAARADNSIGIFGIAPEAEIIAIKACWQRAPQAPGALCSSWTLAKAVDFALHAGAQVLNFSLAGPPDPLLARLIATAVQRHITIVAAVLEEGERGPGFPASLETVIAIRTSDPRRHVHSAVGKSAAALAAPGIDILTTAPHEAYAFLSGSSLAAAHVTGIVALLLEHEPYLTPTQVQALLRTTAQPIAGAASAAQGPTGIVDACAALEQLLGGQVCS